MSRRSEISLLILVAAAAAVSLWLLRSPAVEGTTAEAPGATAQPGAATQPGAAPQIGKARTATPPAALASPPVAESDSSPAADHVVSTAPSARSAVEIDPDAELATAYWVAGRVVVPPDTPADEHAEVLADGAKFERRPLFQSPISPDGGFKVAFSHETGLATLQLRARYLYLTGAFTIELPAPKRKIVLDPVLGGCIRGRLVLPPAGLALRSSLVGSSVRATLGRGKAPAIGKVDANLEFEIGGLPGETYSISLEAPGVALSTRDGLAVVPGRIVTTDLDLRLGGRISGTAIDPSGRPVNRARIVARSIFDAGDRTLEPAKDEEEKEATTDPDGRFELASLESGAWQLEACGAGLARSEGVRIDLRVGEESGGWELRLRRPSRISGHVLAAGGKPARGVSVQLTVDPPPADRRHRPCSGSNEIDTEADGLFEFEGMCPGTYRVFARTSEMVHPCTMGVLEGIRVPEGSEVDGLVLSLGTPGRIAGSVIGPDGQPAAGARITVRELEEGGFYCGPGAVADGSGRFILDGLRPGEVHVSAQSVKHDAIGDSVAVVRTGETAVLDLKLVAATFLIVTLEGEDDLVRNSVISVIDRGGKRVIEGKGNRTARFSPTSGKSVAYGITGMIPAGTYTVEALSASGARASREVQVSTGAPVSVTLQLKR